MSLMYHISRKDLGETTALKPKIPKYRHEAECSTTRRVCFSPTVEQCVLGLIGFGINRELTIFTTFLELASPIDCPTVYCTNEKLFKPLPIGDFGITDEHWSLEPIVVERCGYLDCMAMVEDRQVRLISEPCYIDDAKADFIHYLTDEDKVYFKSILNKGN